MLEKYILEQIELAKTRLAELETNRKDYSDSSY